jgi:hypothetical protein
VTTAAMAVVGVVGAAVIAGGGTVVVDGRVNWTTGIVVVVVEDRAGCRT